ncbi:MAG: acyclic terpene utilization AtuA family protein [Burkholderiales bacterium]|nr:acyclic terpene utilization AtuA family protein [Burkholderiales bacterium]
MKDRLRVLISTGHLGTAPSGAESFRLGMDSNPDYVVADAGSSDPGPVYLGEDTTLGHFVREELELFLAASRAKRIPLVIGSAGDTGSNRGVDEFVSIVKELAREHRIPKFRIGYFYSEVPKEYLRRKLAGGAVLAGLGGFPQLTAEEIDSATRIVAVSGVHPFLRLLGMGADVIIAGRCGDVCFTAGPCIHHGFPEALAYHMGKMIECASLVAEPFMGKETIVGTISREDIRITPYHPQQRCTVASVAGHSMYERETPYFEHALGGTLDMRECRYQQHDARSVRIAGAKWLPASELRVKIEGAKKIGERYMGFVGLRDPHVVGNVDAAIEWCQSAVARRFGSERYELHFHVFGRDGVLKDMEPLRQAPAHELGVVVEGVAATDALAEKITDFAVRMFFLVRIPGVKGTAGAAATTKKTMKSSPGYTWNVNHTVPIDDPMELFPVHLTEAGV